MTHSQRCIQIGKRARSLRSSADPHGGCPLHCHCDDACRNGSACANAPLCSDLFKETRDWFTVLMRIAVEKRNPIVRRDTFDRSSKPNRGFPDRISTISRRSICACWVGRQCERSTKDAIVPSCPDSQHLMAACGRFNFRHARFTLYFFAQHFWNDLYFITSGFTVVMGNLCCLSIPVGLRKRTTTDFYKSSILSLFTAPYGL